MKVLNNNIFVRIIAKDEAKTTGGIIVNTIATQESTMKVLVEEVSDTNPDGIAKGDTLIIPKGSLREFQIDDKMNTEFVMNNSVLCVL